jgi:hypothetical protein
MKRRHAWAWGLLSCALTACNGETRDMGGSDDPSGSGGASSGSGSTVTTGNGGSGGASTSASSSGSGGAPDPGPTWGEADPGVTVGPFGAFKAFRSGCGEQIWARWIPLEDFALGVQTIHEPNGFVNQTQYFEVPVFLAQEKTVFLLDGNGGFDAGDYTFDFKVGYEDQSVLTHTLTVPADELFRWPGQIEFVSAHNDAFQGLQVAIEPKIGGDVGRIFLYDAASECVITSKQFLSSVPIKSGVATEIDVGAQGLAAGTALTLVLQGADSARGYIYYATIEFTAP